MPIPIPREMKIRATVTPKCTELAIAVLDITLKSKGKTDRRVATVASPNESITI